MPLPKPLFREDIVRAMAHTKSNKAAARYLGCSYQHYKRYAKLFTIDAEGRTLWDEHLNQCGKGIPKFLVGTKKEPALEAILNGELDPSSFSPDRIRQRLIFEGYLLEGCSRCSFAERRVTDYRMPLLLNFKNGNKKHYAIENLELLCYNCFFLYVADPFTTEQINIIEDFHVDKFKVEKVTWDLDADMLENMRELGIE